MQKNKNKIVLLLKNHISDYDYIRFDLKYLTSKYDVIFLDLQKILLKKSLYKNNTTKIRAKDVKNIYSFFKILRKINIKNIISFVGHPKNFLEFFLYIILKYYKCNISFIDLAPKVGTTFKTENKLFFYSRNFSKFIKVTKKYIFNQFYKFFKIDYENVIVGGAIEQNNRHKYFKNIIKSHSLDFSLFKNLYLDVTGVKAKYTGKDYAIFLDDDLPEHIDYKINKQEPPVNDIKKYYNELLTFFKFFESNFNLEIIIASHPKREKLSYFKNFKIIKYKTPELIMNSSVTFVHASNSLSFSVLAKKPIIFLTSHEINRSWMGSRIVNLSKILNSRLLNIDNKDYNLSKENLLICKKSYQNYKNKYLICDENIKSIWSNLDF
mgnify:CR=1 FL=1